MLRVTAGRNFEVDRAKTPVELVAVELSNISTDAGRRDRNPGPSAAKLEHLLLFRDGLFRRSFLASDFFRDHCFRLRDCPLRCDAFFLYRLALLAYRRRHRDALVAGAVARPTQRRWL